jgi:hypothetical protein
MALTIVYLAVLLGGGVALFFLPASSLATGLVGGLTTGVAVPLIAVIVANRFYLSLAFWVAVNRKKLVRVSISYLYRIKLDSDYMLIRGRRFPGFIPVGGVYKLSPSARDKLERLNVLDDDLVPLDPESRDDLRVRVPATNLISFVRWFESGRARETSPWREFWEELVKTGILPPEHFPWIMHTHLKRQYESPRFNPVAQMPQMLIADVHEVLPNESQLVALRLLRNTGHPDILWVKEAQIRRRGLAPGFGPPEPIAKIAEWIL